MNRYTRSLVIFFTLLIAVLGTVGALNIVVDPYTLYGSERRQFVNAVNPDLGSHSRFVKAAEIIKLKPERVILGSSVVDGGFPVKHMQKSPTRRRGMTTRLDDDMAENGFVFNAGVRGGSLWDVYAYLRHAKVNNPNLSHAVLGLEHSMFTELNPPVPKPEFDDILEHRWFAPRVLFERTLSWAALRDSVRLVAGNNQSRFDRLGEIAGPVLGRLLDTVISAAQADDNSVAARPTLTPVPSHLTTAYPVLARSVSESRTLVFSAAVVEDVRRRLVAGGSGVLDREESYAVMEKIVVFARENDIRLDVYISPQHWIYWAAWLSANQMSHVENWWRRLAEITPFWDFGDTIERSIRVDEYFESEPLHFGWDAGQIILETLLLDADDEDADKGAILVTQENIEDVIVVKRTKLKEKLAQEIYVAEVLQFTGPSRTAGYWDQQAPQQYDPPYRGFRVVRAMERFYALPTDDAPYDLRAILSGACSPMFEAETIEEVMGAIDGFDRGPVAGVGCGGGLDPEFARASYAEVNRRWSPEGKAIASGTWITPPEAAFDGDPKTFWPSNFFGEDVAGRAWIGFAFDHPKTFRAITVLQREFRQFRQDRIRLQTSTDGGATWADVGDGIFQVEHERDVLILPPTPPATHWRLTAMGDNATTHEHVWSVHEIQFLERGDVEFDEIFRRVAFERSAGTRP